MIYKNFEYYNPNPKGLITGDCQIRALTKALDWSWYEVYDLLYKIGRERCEPYYWKGYLDVLEKDFGFIPHSISPAKRGSKRMDVKGFCVKHPEGTFVLQVANHLMCVKDGKYYDLDACFGNRTIYKYWEVVKERQD